MTTLHLIFLVFAFVFFVCAGLKFPADAPMARVHLGWLGLAFLTLALWLH